MTIVIQHILRTSPFRGSIKMFSETAASTLGYCTRMRQENRVIYDLGRNPGINCTL